MAQQADASGSLAVSTRPPSAAYARPKPFDNHRTHSTASALAVPVRPAEIAQARVFEGLLQAECAELQELAHHIGRAPDQRPDSDSFPRLHDLTQIQARLDEVHGLLRALQGRFLHAKPDRDY